jgi:alpha-glucosidase
MDKSSRREFIINTQALLIAAAVPPGLSAAAGRKRDLTLISPGGNLVVAIGINVAGRLWYSVVEGTTEVLAPSPLGLVVDGVDLGQGAQFIGAPSIREINESYRTLGNHSEAKDHAKEMHIALETAGKHFSVVARAYDDGAAIRYLLPKGARHIDADSTSWKLPERLMKVVWATYDAPYEGLSHATALDDIPEKGSIMGPVMVQTASHYLSISEADCENFSDMNLVRRGKTLQVNFPFEPSGWDIQSSVKDGRAGVLHGTYLGRSASPWRSTVVTRNLTSLINSDLLTNLCPAPAPHSNFDWVKPGRSLWSWWSVDDPPYSELKAWYDAAADMKWEYYLIDAGWIKWSSPGKDNWAMLKDISDYGKSVGVESIVWGQYTEMPSPAERRKWLENAKACGVAGVKLDFPPKATASTMNWWYLATLQDCAELKLLVDFHGSVKPTGLQRTYPNGITREAVRGNEYNMSRYKRIQPYSEDVTLPFGRPLAGPADVTPIILNPHELVPSGFTWSHQLAQAVVYLSPVTVFCDEYKYYLDSPFKDLLQEIPTVWDETRVLTRTEIGDLVTFARRKADAWWIGIINGDHKRETQLSFDFLSQFALAVFIFDDPLIDAAVVRQEREVKPMETLNLTLKPGGGFVARIKLSKTI